MASSSAAAGAVPYDAPPPPYSRKATEGAVPMQYGAPQPQQPMPQGNYFQYQTAGPGTTVLVTEQPVYNVTTVYGFARTPVAMVCPHCHVNIVTKTHTEPGALTWFIFALLIFLCCWIFAWIPFVDPSTKDVIHTCPQCNAVVGKFKRM